MTSNLDPNVHLGDDAAARRIAQALDALAAAEMAGAPAGLSDRIARASMPTRSTGLRLAGSAARPWAVRMRPVFAMAAAVALIAGTAIFLSTRSSTTPSPGPIADSTTPAPVVDPINNSEATTAAPQLAIAKASSDVETWLAVGNEMDAMLSSTVADLSATASDLEERAYTAFAADDWYSEASL